MSYCVLSNNLIYLSIFVSHGDMYVKNVLIVDDSSFMRRMMKSIVIGNGYNVIGEAENGQLAVEKYKELMPDLVTMDVTMKVMSGLEALGEILAFDPNAKVVMVSSMSQEIIVREAIALGAKGFIVKPFDDKQIISAFLKIS